MDDTGAADHNRMFESLKSPLDQARQDLKDTRAKLAKVARERDGLRILLDNARLCNACGARMRLNEEEPGNKTYYECSKQCGGVAVYGV